MRVLTLTPFYPTDGDDGAGCFIAEPIRALEKFDVESCVVAVRPYHRGKAAVNGRAPHARWIRFASIPGGIGLASAGAFLYARIISKVQQLHSSEQFDLIHAHAALPCGHAAALLSQRLGIPFVVTVHGLDAYLKKQVPGLAGRWCERRARSVYEAAECVICISDLVAKQVKDGLNEVNTTVIYNGVDAELFSSPDADSAHASLLSVGNLIPIKGHEMLFRAFAAARRNKRDLRCDIIGDGPEQSHLEHLAAELGISDCVRFLGRQSRAQVATALRQCTLFVLPSRYEGLGCVYLEAMSAQRPAIACHGQGIDEIIRHGENGWLVEAGNWQKLADSITHLLDGTGLRQQIGLAARQTILQRFTLGHQAAALAQVYRGCAA